MVFSRPNQRHTNGIHKVVVCTVFSMRRLIKKTSSSTSSSSSSSSSSSVIAKFFNPRVPSYVFI
jgi:hypothetical protein